MDTSKLGLQGRASRASRARQLIPRFLTRTRQQGTPVTAPQLGDVIVFDFGGGDHHVTLFEKDNGDGTWSCHRGLRAGSWV